MRILHIDTGREMRGGQWQVLHLLQGLAARGLAARLLAPTESHLYRAATSMSLDVQPLRWHSLPRDVRGFDMIHAHDAHAHTFGLVCPQPLLVSRRVAFPIGLGILAKWKYRRATHFLAVSRFVQDILIGAGIPRDKVSVVYDGVRLPERSSAAERSLVLALDSDDPKKGKALTEKAATLAGVPVHFSKQLLRDLPQASVFLYMSELEGLGSAALLAMAHGATVVASNVGGLAEIVEHGITGLLTENTPSAIACAITHLRGDPEFAARLSTQARKRVERHFTVEHMVEQTIRAYERVLA